MYLHWTSENSTGRTPIIYYALWVLYVLSAATVVGDFVDDLFGYVSIKNSTSKNNVF